MPQCRGVGAASLSRPHGGEQERAGHRGSQPRVHQPELSGATRGASAPDSFVVGRGVGQGCKNGL